MSNIIPNIIYIYYKTLDTIQIYAKNWKKQNHKS